MCQKIQKKSQKSHFFLESQTRRKNGRKKRPKGYKKGISQMKNKNARRLPKTPNLPQIWLRKTPSGNAASQ
jgi:hypothetical protein